MKNDEVVKKPKVEPNAVTGILEVGLDSMLEGGIFRDIPIINTVIGIIKTCGTVRDYLLTKMLHEFLLDYNNASPQDKERYLSKFKSEKQRERLTEKLIITLNRIDDTRKPRMLSRAFKAFLSDQIDWDELVRLWRAIDMVLYENIIHIGNVGAGHAYDAEIGQQLVASGLWIQGAPGTKTWVASEHDFKMSYKLSRTGKLFLDIVLAP